jgi:hypothetical protein
MLHKLQCPLKMFVCFHPYIKSKQMEEKKADDFLLLKGFFSDKNGGKKLSFDSCRRFKPSAEV